MSNCRREERILPLLDMENIPSLKLSWALSCSSLMSDGKIPLASVAKFATCEIQTHLLSEKMW